MSAPRSAAHQRRREATARCLAAATPDRAVDVIDATGGALRGAGADFDAMDDDTRDTAYDCMTAALLALGARVD